MKKILFTSGYFLFLLTSILQAQTGSEYRVVRKMALPGDNGWDYLADDPASARLFVSHGTTVQVIDTREGKLIGEIGGQNGVHGIALANALRKGFISNGRDSSVTVFNLDNLSILQRIKVTGKNPDAILYDEVSKRVFTFNGGSSNATVIDAESGKVVATISLEGKPEFAVTDGKGKIYVNIEDKSILQVIDPVALKVTGQWSIAPGEELSGLAIDIANNLLFSVCDNKMMVVSDAVAGKAITTVPIGSRVDGAAFDPGLRRAYSSNGDGSVTVIQETNIKTFQVIGQVQTQKGARTMTIDPVTHHLFLSAADYEAPPAPTSENPRPRPAIKPGTFVVLELEPVK